MHIETQNFKLKASSTANTSADGGEGEARDPRPIDTIETHKASWLRLRQLLMELNEHMGGAGLIHFWDAACLFEVNLVGANLFCNSLLYKHVNSAAQKLLELWTCDWQLKSAVRDFKFIVRIQARRAKMQGSG